MTGHLLGDMSLVRKTDLTRLRLPRVRARAASQRTLVAAAVKDEDRDEQLLAQQYLKLQHDLELVERSLSSELPAAGMPLTALVAGGSAAT